MNLSPKKEQTICLWIVHIWLPLWYFLKFICLRHKLEVQWAKPVSLTFHSALEKFIQNLPLCFLPSFCSFGHAVSEKNIFFWNRPIRNKNCLWWPCLLTDRNLMSNLYRGPSKDASYQVSVHLVKRFQRRRFFFRNQPIRKKNCLWRPCLITDHNEMSNLYRGRSIDTSNQVSVHLAKQFQRRRFILIGQSETRIACGGHVC